MAEPTNLVYPMRVLIADDEPAQARLIQRHLQESGHEAVLVEDGLRALHAARSEKFDVIILDVMMPHMNGFEVLEQIRQDDSFREVLVIMLTAEKELDSIVKGYCTGANVYLTKPVDPAAILKLIES